MKTWSTYAYVVTEGGGGFQVIDLASGRCVHWFRIEGPVRELYDVAVLEGVRCPRSVSDQDDEGLDLITVERRTL